MLTLSFNATQSELVTALLNLMYKHDTLLSVAIPWSR